MGCVTTYKNFQPSNVKFNEGIAIGNVNIIDNGKNQNSTVWFVLILSMVLFGLSCPKLEMMAVSKC